VQQTLIFPLLLLAGVLLPLEGAPGWLQTAADLNPMTYIVEASRVLFAGSYPADTIGYGFVGAGVVAVLGLVVGLRTMRHSS
jgi:ABC-2 type transport system permease protein